MLQIRFYVCPLAYDAEFLGNYPKLHDYNAHTRWSTMIPTGVAGKPKFNKALVMVVANDHSVYRADPEIIDILAPLNFEGKTKSEIVERLRSITIGDIPLKRRQAILARLGEVGISKEQVVARISLSDNLLKVLRLLLEYLKDDRDVKTADDAIETGYLGE